MTTSFLIARMKHLASTWNLVDDGLFVALAPVVPQHHDDRDTSLSPSAIEVALRSGAATSGTGTPKAVRKARPLRIGDVDDDSSREVSNWGGQLSFLDNQKDLLRLTNNVVSLS